MMASPLGEELVEAGREQSRTAARERMLLMTESRFPGMLRPSSIGDVKHLAKLQSLFRGIVAAKVQAEAGSAIEGILGSRRESRINLIGEARQILANQEGGPVAGPLLISA